MGEIEMPGFEKDISTGDRPAERLALWIVVVRKQFRQ